MIYGLLILETYMSFVARTGKTWSRWFFSERVHLLEHLGWEYAEIQINPNEGFSPFNYYSFVLVGLHAGIGRSLFSAVPLAEGGQCSVIFLGPDSRLPQWCLYGIERNGKSIVRRLIIILPALFIYFLTCGFRLPCLLLGSSQLWRPSVIWICIVSSLKEVLHGTTPLLLP